jgi:hypothetical protein
VQFSSVDLLAFIFSWMLVNLRFCQGRLGWSFAGAHLFESNTTGMIGLDPYNNHLLSLEIWLLFSWGPARPNPLFGQGGLWPFLAHNPGEGASGVQWTHNIFLWTGLRWKFSGCFTTEKFWLWRWIQRAVCTTFQWTSLVRVSTS